MGKNKINPYGMRYLRADEIDVRVAQVGEKWCTILLYKDARVDMAILDETYGAGYWQREHEVINGNLFCTISIWNKDIKQWVKKQDVGTESYTEKEKGQASDSFKRAGVNAGIGRELYTTPKSMFISLGAGETYQKNSKYAVNRKLSFVVTHIDYDDAGNISELKIDDNNGKTRYAYKNNKPVELPQSHGREQGNVNIPEESSSSKESTNKKQEQQLKANKISNAQIKDIHVLASSLYGTEDIKRKDGTSVYRSKLNKEFKVTSCNELSENQADIFIKYMNREIENNKKKDANKEEPL